MKILSTKILTPSQKKILADFQVLEVSMIAISYGEGFQLAEKVPYAIFTSGNSVKSVFGVHQNSIDLFQTVFCVGEKTKYLLEQYGLKVDVVANNALELAENLVENFHDIQEMSWFCGNLRNNDLPILMAENGVLVTEYLVYQTQLISKKIEEEVAAILFYSPSGVRSYLKSNSITHTPVVCIGATTATEAVQYFKNVFIAEEQTVESVLKKAKEIIEQ